MTKRPKAPKEFEPCRFEARFVAVLLRIQPEDVFPIAPGCDEDDDAHFVIYVCNKVDSLKERLAEGNDGTPEFREYRRTLALCADVMNGKVFAPPESQWESFAARYRRGLYHRRGTTGA